MFIEIERYVKFITDNNLTQRQFLFLYLRYMDRFDLMKKYMEKFPTEDGKFLGGVELKDLIEREFIIKVEDTGKAKDYKIGDNFKKIFIDKHIAADQLLNAYPSFMVSDGKKMPLTLMDKYDLMNTYANRIAHSIEEHEEVLKDLKYGLDNDLIKFKIENFIRSEFWVHLRKLRLDTNVIIIENELN